MWQQLGCYGPQPSYAPFRYTYPAASNDQCLQTCADHGFFFAALTGGNQCDCDYGNPAWGTPVDCTAGPLPAGGLNMYSIPSKLVDGWKNLGCIGDHDLLFDKITRVLTGLVDLKLTSVQWPVLRGSFDSAGCVAYCDSLNFKIAGNENSDQCFCGNSFTGAGVALSNSCIACAKDRADLICGGSGSLSVYSKEFADLPSVPGASLAAKPPTPTDLVTSTTTSTLISGGGSGTGGGNGGTRTTDSVNGDNGPFSSSSGSPSTADGDISSTSVDQGHNPSSTEPPAPTQSDGSIPNSTSEQPVASNTQTVPSSGDFGNENKLGGISRSGGPGFASQRRPMPSQSLTLTKTPQPLASNPSNDASTNDSSAQMSDGAAAGIIAASIALVVSLMIIVILLIHKRLSKEEKGGGRLVPPMVLFSQAPDVDFHCVPYHHQVRPIERFTAPDVSASVDSDTSTQYTSEVSTENGAEEYSENIVTGIGQSMRGRDKKANTRHESAAPPYENLLPPGVRFELDVKKWSPKQ